MCFVDAAFILCTEEFSPNETKDILNFMLSDYAQKGNFQSETQMGTSQVAAISKAQKAQFLKYA